MLNDLHEIERGMTANGIIPPDDHEDIKDMAKGLALRVRLGVGGRIAQVEIIADAGRGAQWTLRDGQHNGFPGLRLGEEGKDGQPPKGLLSLRAAAREVHERAWGNDKTPLGRRVELSRLLAENPVDATMSSSWPNAGHRKRIAERLDALRPLSKDPSTASVPAAFERFLLALEVSPSLVENLTEALREKVGSGGDEWLEPARAALIGPIALAIDVAESDFDRDAGDPRQIEYVSAELSAASDDVEGQCALTGKLAKLHSGNFPQPNLPGLGQTYVFSRNKDIPSLTRYGRTADASFPIDSGLVRRLAGTVKTLTNKDAEGRTWRLIPAEAGDKQDLLVVSLVSDPDAGIADAIADDDRASVDGATRWDELGKRLLSQTRGDTSIGHLQDEVNVLVLRTVDPANRKAIYHRKTNAAEFWKAAERWKAALSNAPEWLGFPLPEKGKSEVTFRRPAYVAPLSIISLSRRLFVSGGRRTIEAIGVPAADAFGHFLREGDADRRTRRLLRLLLRRHGSLLRGVAVARLRGTDHLKSFDPKTDLRRNALRSVAWIAALLHSLGRQKELYMSDAAFRLGQFLAAADVVHIGYCMDVRGGSIPPTLIGNSVFGLAGANPMRALSMLQGRWKPYDAWAKRLSSGDGRKPQTKGDEAGWAIRNGRSQARRIRELCPPLAEELKQVKVSDEFRAELLLGYIAGLPPLPKKAMELEQNSDSDASKNEGEQQ
jgi:hypothetical protein